MLDSKKFSSILDYRQWIGKLKHRKSAYKQRFVVSLDIKGV